MSNEVTNYNIIIIGGGPAGMLAALGAKETTSEPVAILDKNNLLGRKLLLTGKGRCNITNSCELKDMIAAFGKRGNFLYGPLTRFSNQDLISLLNQVGLETKVEGGKRVFPKSDKAEDVVLAIKNQVKNKKVKILNNTTVLKIKKSKDGFRVICNKKISFECQKLIIATGGRSYPETGSTGDGYRWARDLGHAIITPTPALVPLFIKDERIRNLAGLDLDNIKLSIIKDNQEELSAFGDMIFTHLGISGPIVHDLSNSIYKLIKDKSAIYAKIDLKPALDEEVLKKRVYRDIHNNPKQEYQTLLNGLIPRSLVPLAIELTKVEKHDKNGQLTPEQTNRLLNFLKNFRFRIDAVAPIEAGIITEGGVDIKEINSTTMESKISPGLYFAGEVINLHGPTGGFNLQQAFSTGWLAGYSAGASLK